MSEVNTEITEETNETPGTETPGTGTTPEPEPGSIINSAVESVMDLIDAIDLFATITRGALGSRAGLCCEIAPSTPEAVYLDKNKYIPIDLTLNGKHDDLQTLSEAMNTIHEGLTFLKTYPSGTGWNIVDIVTQTEPQVIARTEENLWLMASNLLVKVQTEKE